MRTSLAFIFSRQGQGEVEATPMARGALCPDATIMGFHNAFADGEPQAGAPDLPHGGVMSPIEGIKDPPQLSSGNAIPLVGNGEVHLPVLPLGADGHPPP